MYSYVLVLGVLFSSTYLVRCGYDFKSHLHDYVRDGREPNGDFPSNFATIPYYCYQVPSKGPCGLMMEAWYYDVVRRKCMQFYYSGCGGNENRFPNKGLCLNHCEKKRTIY